MDSLCVIFDLDGTLVESETLCNQAFLDLVPQLEVSIGDMIARYSGRKITLIIEDIEHRIGRELPSDFIHTYRAHLAELLEHDLKPIPGVPEMLANLDAPTCVASNAPLQKIELALRVCGLEQFFGNNIFSAYTIEAWKPDPALFLHAAKAMGHHPTRCAVIEDSPTGVAASLAAGMHTFQYAPKDPSDNTHENVNRFGNMSQLPELLKNI